MHKSPTPSDEIPGPEARADVNVVPRDKNVKHGARNIEFWSTHRSRVLQMSYAHGGRMQFVAFRAFARITLIS